MKQTGSIGAVLVIIGLAFSSSGLLAQESKLPATAYGIQAPLETRVWDLGIYPFNDEKAVVIMQQVMKAGLFPTGIEVVSGDSINIVYARLPNMPAKDAYITVITDLKDVNAVVQNQIIDKGYMPMDISVTAKGIYVLYIPAPMKINQWRIFNVKGVTLDVLKSGMSEYEVQGFSLVGMSLYSDHIWVLALKTEKPLFPGSEIKGYPNDGTSFPKGLEFQASQGSLPLGFMFTKDMVYCNFNL